MSSEEIEPDARRSIDGNYYNLVVDSEKETHVHDIEDVAGDYKQWEPLFSAETIQNQLEKSKIENPNKFGNQEERQQALHWNKKIREMIEVFSSNEQ